MVKPPQILARGLHPKVLANNLVDAETNREVLGLAIVSFENTPTPSSMPTLSVVALMMKFQICRQKILLGCPEARIRMKERGCKPTRTHVR